MTVPAQPTTPRGERRSVTVVFADLSNFTGLGERLDPEDLTALVRECFSELNAEIRAFDGWLEKQIGDALVAIFGAPVAHEDDPVRGVLAALAIRDRVSSLSERVRERVGAPLDVHIGINTGLAVLTPGLERDGDDEFVVLGDAVTTAARLQQAARAGQILVGETTYSATDWCFEYRGLPPLKLKGKQSRVAAWECLGTRPERGRGPRLVRHRATPLVGRVSERAAVSRCLDALTAGRGALVLLTGDPGIGKTRLLAESRAGAEERGVLWLEGGTASFGETPAYAPFVEVLRELCAITRADDDATAWAKLEQHVLELFGEAETADALPYLGILLALELPDGLAASVRYLDGEGVGLQIFRAARRLFARLARRQPLALVFEDWHWVDETSAALLEHLLPVVQSAPLLLVCSTRTEPSPVPAHRRLAIELGLGDRVVDLELQPLVRAEARELVASLVVGDALAPGLRDELLETTEGNPFFIEEVVRSLVDGRSDTGGLELPDTLRGAITARVDRLPNEARELLRTAAVLGRSFAPRLLRELAGEDRVDAALQVLAQTELVREVPGAPERELAFKHAVTHDVVYGSILLSQRRTLHLRVAELLQRVFADRLDELAGTIAFHYAQAQDWDSAQAFLFRAGDHAGEVAASAEALAYYRKAVDAYARAFGDRWDARQRAELDRKVGEAFFRRGEHDRATEYLERALSPFGFSYPATRGRLRLAIARAAAAQAAHRLLPIPRFRRIADEPDGWMDELSRILDTLGWIYFFSDPERVVLDSFRQLNTAERRGFRLAMVRASTGLGFVFDAIPIRRLAGSYHGRAVVLSGRLENRRSVGIAYLGLGHHQRYQLAKLEEAVGSYARAAEECRSAGDLRGWMGATLTLAEATGLMGDAEASLSHGRRLLVVGEDAGDNQVRGWGHHAVGRALRLAGLLEQARAHLERGSELSERVPDYQALLVARGNLGLVLIELGDLDQALSVLEATLELERNLRLRTFAATDLLEGVTRARLAAVDDAGPAARKSVLRDARDACRSLSRQTRLDRAATPTALRSEGTYRWLRRQPTRAEALWRKSIAAADAVGAPYARALTELEWGRRIGEDALVGRGRSALDDIASRVGARAASEAELAVASQYETQARADGALEGGAR